MLKPAFLLAAVLALSLPAGAETKGHDHKHDHGHGHSHGLSHGHDHAKDAKSVHAGYFEDAAVADRPLSDWEGEWQSVYPLLQAGLLDPVMEAKAAKGEKTAAEYRAYYETGYRTDLGRIEIKGDKVSFQRGDKRASARYVSDGYEILTYAKGNRGVRFIFKKVEGDAEAPGFLQFSDHIIAPQKADHYHIYLGDDRSKLLAEVTHWPTYYPADLSGEMIVEEMLAH